MKHTLFEYIPVQSQDLVKKLLGLGRFTVKIKTERKTKRGDYRKLSNGKHQITVNSNLNPYRFLITLVHEIAHFEAYKTYGHFIKPHGEEWKKTFQNLMLPFLRPDIFPLELLPLLAQHFKNPKASSDRDVDLTRALKQYDADFENKTYIYQLPVESVFKIYNNQTFKKGNTRRKRIECTEITTGRLYLFNPNAEVEKC